MPAERVQQGELLHTMAVILERFNLRHTCAGPDAWQR